MGKKGATASSWLTVVQRAFRSPSKGSEKKKPVATTRLREELQQEEKKREKRRWLFRKPSGHHQQTPTVVQQQTQAKTTPQPVLDATTTAEERHAIAVAVATAAAAEAAVATAQAVVEVARLTRSSSCFEREHFAAVVIQTAFRGYLARRALRALRGLVKLQALVRGHNVRKQAKMTLRCMEALVRAQIRVRDQRARHSQDGRSSKSFLCDFNFWETGSLLETLPEKKSIPREGRYIASDWVDHPPNIAEMKAMITNQKEAALQREKALAYALSQQIRRSDRNLSSSMTLVEEQEDAIVGGEEEKGLATWLDRWTPSRASWDHNCGNKARRTSTDLRDIIKTLEIDTARHSYTNPTTDSGNLYQQQTQPHPVNLRIASPLRHRSSCHQNYHVHLFPATPSPVKTRPLQVRSASPRCGREERMSFLAHSPSASSYYNYDNHGFNGTELAHPHTAAVPNYMAATESAKARIRSHSTPRQRPATPDRERSSMFSAKKRLSFPAADPYGAGGGGAYAHSLRSPTFKSAAGRLGSEQRSTVSSYTESLPGEVSPSSTTDLRRWLRTNQ